MALTTGSQQVDIEHRIRRGLIGATVGLVLAAEFVSILQPGPTIAAVVLMLAVAVGAAPQSSGLLPMVSTLVGGLVGLKAVTLVAGLAGQSSGWLAMIGFMTGVAVVLEMQPSLRRYLAAG